jgi:rfaE bifunctional protein kinase chain/domain
VSRLAAILERFKGRKVAVLGDFVADVFVYGEIARVSREAPVLVLNKRETQLVPGGGANAVHNLRTLGAEPIPVGMVGDDAEGHELLNYFRSLGIDTGRVRIAKAYRTPTKMRILAGAVHSQRQQIVRLDSGGIANGGPQSKLSPPAPPAADAVLVSDYGYGAVTPELAARARRKGIPATIDSRFALATYTGMSAATPNESEVEEALGIRIGRNLDKLEWAGRTLLRRLKHEALLITRGKDGMALFEPRRKTRHIPIHGSDEVTDVTGAGDTVIATFTLALAAGAGYEDAARLANYAGGIVVMKHGTRPITYTELLAAVQEESR